MHKVLDSFCFWTHKGGVGKTTLCFHSATHYAFFHPDVNVLIIDCDPQASLSQTFLTQSADKYCDTNHSGNVADGPRADFSSADMLPRTPGEENVAMLCGKASNRDPDHLVVQAGPLSNLPKSIAGYMIAYGVRKVPNPPPVESFVVNVAEFNRFCPPNVVSGTYYT